MRTPNLLKRIITCVVGIPCMYLMIFTLNANHFLVFAVFAFIVDILACTELSKMLFGKVIPLSLLPWAGLLSEYINADSSMLFCVLLFISLAVEIKNGEQDDFRKSCRSIEKKLLLVFYPTFPLIYVMKMLRHEALNSYILFLFFILVFSNDVFAYIFGMLFGKTNNNILKVSPKKSIAGFAGGFICCIGVSFAYCFLFSSYVHLDKTLYSVLLGSVVALASDLGDLAESVIKRSSQVKDSGSIIPGRGGMLDCLDSICAAAPFFYVIITAL